MSMIDNIKEINKARLFSTTNELGRRFGPLRPFIIPHKGEVNVREGL